MGEKAARFRQLLASDDVVVAPGLFDPLSALLVQKAGFESALISSFALSASMGMCDIGWLSLSEVVDRAARIANAVDIPVLCDGDTGFGNYLNVMRTVEELERAGLAGIMFEDALTPHNRIGRPIISMEEMVGKIQAAVEARRDPNFFIGARTDAAPTLGVDEAIRRGIAYSAAGAEGFIALDVREIDDMKRVNAAVPALAVGVISLPHPPLLSVQELKALGFKIVIPSVPPLFAAVKAMSEVLDELKRSGSLDSVSNRLASTKEITDLLGLPAKRDLEAKYLGTKSGFTPW